MTWTRRARLGAVALALTGACTGEVIGGLDDASSSTDVVTPSRAIELAVDDLIGARVTRMPPHWVIEQEGYLLDGSFGFTLWDPGDGEDPHTRRPIARVALDLDATPGEVPRIVEEKLAEHEGATRIEVTVGGHEGTAVGPIAGAPPTVEAWVPVGDRVYRVNVYGETLDEDAMEALASLSLDGPRVDPSSLGLFDANDERMLYIDGGGPLDALRVDGTRELAFEMPDDDGEGVAAAEARYERRIAEGCWIAPRSFWAQTQHGPWANGTGWVRVGVPNYWGQYTHGNLGWGRCVSPRYTNDKFAIDYPMRRGDPIYSPFRRATVMFAGRHVYYKNYGILVALRDANGKYWNISAHLNGLARGVRRGATVTHRSIIGYAGNTGDPSIPVGPVHLHQAFYRYPRYHTGSAAWAPFGGAGLRITHFRYVGTAAGNGGGVYRFVWPSQNTSRNVSKYDWISN